MPSGTSPLSVHASVWQTPVAWIFTSTSPAFGGATSISTIRSGSPAAESTAARDFMACSGRGFRGREWYARRCGGDLIGGHVAGKAEGRTGTAEVQTRVRPSALPGYGVGFAQWHSGGHAELKKPSPPSSKGV